MDDFIPITTAKKILSSASIKTGALSLEERADIKKVLMLLGHLSMENSIIKSKLEAATATNTTSSPPTNNAQKKTYASTVSEAKTKHTVIIEATDPDISDSIQTFSTFKAKMEKSVNVINKRLYNNKKVIIHCNSSQDVAKVKELLKEDSNIKATVPKKIQPKFIVYGVDRDLNDKEIKDLIIKQNSLEAFENINDMKVIFCKNESENTKSAVIQCPSVAWRHIIQNKHLFLDCSRLRAKEFSLVKQCYKCCRYGHISKFCRNKVCCSKCGGDHSFKDCQTQKTECTNCTHVNNNRKDVNQHIETNHCATDKRCPQFEIKKRIVEERTDYG